MSKNDGGRLTREIRDGRIKLFDLHWDGHRITAKALVRSRTGDGWLFGLGDTVPDAIRDLFATMDRPEEDDLI